MSTKIAPYKCSACGSETHKWAGRCPSCKEWGTVAENASEGVTKSRAAGVKSSGAASKPRVAAARPRDININRHSQKPTGVAEFDRVLGGGYTPGGVILMAGEPGAGKSTLATTLADKAGKAGMTSLFVSSEESREQITSRAKRIGADSDNMFIASETELGYVLGHIEEVDPDLIIVDSLQTMASGEIDSRAGSVSQVVEVATILTRVAKERRVPLILIGQVTKDGNIAGPRTVEHLVDVVCHFEGDKDSVLRLLRGVKNRYGPADEIGCFEHSESGILEVPDPSGLLLGRREEPSAGVATGVIIEGRRPLPIEVQALVVGSALPVPRRAVSGLDSARSIMVQAVVERHGRIRLPDCDVFISTIGGIRTKEPSIDLATGIALASSKENFAMPLGTVVIGELTLSGEVRAVPGVRRRLEEAYRLGFTRAIIPQVSENLNGISVEYAKVGNAAAAIAAAREMSQEV